MPNLGLGLGLGPFAEIGSNMMRHGSNLYLI